MSAMCCFVVKLQIQKLIRKRQTLGETFDLTQT